MITRLRVVLRQDESGMELSEYAIAAALITLAIVAAFQGLATKIVALINSIVSALP